MRQIIDLIIIIQIMIHLTRRLEVGEELVAQEKHLKKLDVRLDVIMDAVWVTVVYVISL